MIALTAGAFDEAGRVRRPAVTWMHGAFKRTPLERRPCAAGPPASNATAGGPTDGRRGLSPRRRGVAGQRVGDVEPLQPFFVVDVELGA